MCEINLEEIIKQTDWAKYNSCSEYYSSDKITRSLLQLYNLDMDDSWKTYNYVLEGVGNNHAGTYYPAILDALPIVCEVALNGEKESARNCALNILIDWTYSFGPAIGDYKEQTSEGLEEFTNLEIKALSSKLDTAKESVRNIELIKELKDFFK